MALGVLVRVLERDTDFVASKHGRAIIWQFWREGTVNPRVLDLGGPEAVEQPRSASSLFQLAAASDGDRRARAPANTADRLDGADDTLTLHNVTWVIKRT